MINLRYCKRCKQPYDIDTSQELCPNCRNKKEGEYDGQSNQ